MLFRSRHYGTYGAAILVFCPGLAIRLPARQAGISPGAGIQAPPTTFCRPTHGITIIGVLRHFGCRVSLPDFVIWCERATRCSHDEKWGFIRRRTSPKPQRSHGPLLSARALTSSVGSGQRSSGFMNKPFSMECCLAREDFATVERWSR